jgi:inosine-uridine nucleoside N-ribohydrolase
MGHVNLPDPISKKIEQSAAEFLVDKVFQFPGEVSVLASGPLTNVALVFLTSSDAVERWHFQAVMYDSSTFCLFTFVK